MGLIKRFGAALLVVLAWTASGGVGAGHASSAQLGTPSVRDAEGCEGLAEYRQQLEELEDDVEAATAVLDEDIFLVTEEEWATAAEEFERIGQEWDAITPPDFATEYHDHGRDALRVVEGLFRSLASGSSPVLEIMARQGTEEELEARLATAMATATSRCPDFEAWFGDEEGATPEAGD